MAVEDHVAVLTLNRPDKLNAWTTWESTRQLGARADQIRFDERGQTVVVRGEARFCAGIDLGMPEDRVTGRSPAEKARNYYEGIRMVPMRRFKVFAELPQPIVAAVQGYRLGFGFELVLMSDIRIAAEDAKFGLPEAQVGVGIDGGGDLRLAHEVGAGWAKMLALTGRRIDARTAERIGIVQEVTTTEELLPTAMTVAHEIAANAPLAVQSIKRSVDGFAYRGLTEAMRFEAMSSSIEFVSDDMPAGYAAKAKKQPIEFEGK